MIEISFNGFFYINIGDLLLINKKYFLEECKLRDLEFTKNEKAELIYDIIAGIMAVISVLVVMMDISNSATEKGEYYVHIIDNLIYFLFVADYFIRMITSKEKKRFFLHNIIDLIAILPLGFFPSIRYGSILKLIRVFTYLLRLVFNVKEFVFTNNFIYALGITIIIIIAGSIGIYFFEFNNNDGINTYGDAVWLSIVTVSTVGYGDVFVVTKYGRIVACTLMITGVGFLSMLTSTMSTFFFKRHAEDKINNYSKDTEVLVLDISNLSEENKKNIMSYYNFLRFKDKI